VGAIREIVRRGKNPALQHEPLRMVNEGLLQNRVAHRADRTRAPLWIKGR
jgi:hypothetical protein